MKVTIKNTNHDTVGLKQLEVELYSNPGDGGNPSHAVVTISDVINELRKEPGNSMHITVNVEELKRILKII